MIRCGVCGLMVTAEHKVNRFGSRYVYYHCTKRRMTPHCQQPSIEVKELEGQIVRFLEDLTIAEKVHRVVIARLNDLRSHRELEAGARKRSLGTTLDGITAELSELTGLRLRNLVTDHEFLSKRQEIQQEQLRLIQQLKRMHTEAARFEPVKDLILLSKNAASWFARGDNQSKKLIIETVSSNLSLKDKILTIEAKKPFRPWSNAGSNSQLLAVINDARTFLNTDDENVKHMVENARLLKKQFENGEINKAA
jgi:hypothetical protein